MGWPCRLGKGQQALLRLLCPHLLFHSSELLRVGGEAREADIEVTDITDTGPTVTQEGHILCGTIFLDLLFPQNPRGEPVGLCLTTGVKGEGRMVLGSAGLSSSKPKCQS